VQKSIKVLPIVEKYKKIIESKTSIASVNIPKTAK
jgi:hypothetical protein